MTPFIRFAKPLFTKTLLPTSDRVCADDEMYSCETVALIQRVAEDAFAEEIPRRSAFSRKNFAS